jgi:hypothetical protein
MGAFAEDNASKYQFIRSDGLTSPSTRGTNLQQANHGTGCSKLAINLALLYIMDCANPEEAGELVDASSIVRDGVLEFEIARVNHFPRFA